MDKENLWQIHKKALPLSPIIRKKHDSTLPHCFESNAVIFVQSDPLAQNNIIILSKTNLLFQKYFVTLRRK